MAASETVQVGVGPLAADDVVAVARHGVRVEVTADALATVAATRERIEALAASDKPVYGVSTGFGALATRHIPLELRTQLQQSLIRSHAAGSGPEVEREVIRALMLLRLSTLATGRTGVRPVVVETYAALLNSGITPVVHEYGSLGCSGDLAPLAHCALVLMGEGVVRDAAGARRPAAEALASAGIEPVVLAEKEGLALINGTDGMLGMLVLACHDLGRLLTTADITAAMSVEGLMGTDRVFAADLQELRPQPGQALSASNLRAMLAGSPIIASHRTEQCAIVQDAYSLRCAPTVAGAGRDTLEHARRVAGHELAAAVDNPVVTLSGSVESNGNFHGAPVGYVLDFLAIAVADLASMSERRTDRFLDAKRNHGLPPFLADDPGVDSGPDDPAVHAGGRRRRAEAAGRAGLGRLDSQLGHAGGPRVSGLARRPQAAARPRRAGPGSGRRGADRRARARPARARAGARDPGGARPHPGRRARPGTRPVPRPRDRGRRGAGGVRCADRRRGRGRWSAAVRGLPRALR